MDEEINTSPELASFLRNNAEKFQQRIRESGKPIPEWLMFHWKVLLMFQILLGENKDPETLKRVEAVRLLEWK